MENTQTHIVETVCKARSNEIDRIRFIHVPTHQIMEFNLENIEKLISKAQRLAKKGSAELLAQLANPATVKEIRQIIKEAKK